MAARASSPLFPISSGAPNSPEGSMYRSTPFKKSVRLVRPFSERNGDSSSSSTFKNFDGPVGSETDSHMSLKRSSVGSSGPASTNVGSSGPALRRSLAFSRSDRPRPEPASYRNGLRKKRRPSNRLNSEFQVLCNSIDWNVKAEQPQADAKHRISPPRVGRFELDDFQCGPERGGAVTPLGARSPTKPLLYRPWKEVLKDPVPQHPIRD